MIRWLFAESGNILLKAAFAVIAASLIGYLLYVQSLKAMTNVIDNAQADMKKEQLKRVQQRDNARETISGVPADRGR